MLCIDNRDRLNAEETLSRGTVDKTPVYVRKVINGALKHHAKAVILVHNYPSGERELPARRYQYDGRVESRTGIGHGDVS